MKNKPLEWRALDIENIKLTRKIFVSLISLYVMFLLITIVDSTTKNIANIGYLARHLIPSISSIVGVSNIGDFISATLGNGMLIAPLMAVYFSFNDSLGRRFTYGYSRPSSGLFKTSLFIYGIALPVVGLLLYFSYHLPAAILQSDKVTFGASVVRAISLHKITTIVLGPPIVVGLSILQYLIIICIVGPFSKKIKEI